MISEMSPDKLGHLRDDNADVRAEIRGEARARLLHGKHRERVCWESGKINSAAADSAAGTRPQEQKKNTRVHAHETHIRQQMSQDLNCILGCLYYKPAYMNWNLLIITINNFIKDMKLPTRDVSGCGPLCVMISHALYRRHSTPRNFYFYSSGCVPQNSRASRLRLSFALNTRRYSVILCVG